MKTQYPVQRPTNHCWVLQILVVFSGPGIVKVNGVRDIAGQIVNRESLTGLILIVQNQITSQALKAVNLLSFKVEIFQVCFSLSHSSFNSVFFFG